MSPMPVTCGRTADIAIVRLDWPQHRNALNASRAGGVPRPIPPPPVPVAAAMGGAAVGFGFDLALACGVRFIPDPGGLLLGWDRVALVPGGGGLPRLSKLGGTRAAWHILGERKP